MGEGVSRKAMPTYYALDTPPCDPDVHREGSQLSAGPRGSRAMTLALSFWTAAGSHPRYPDNPGQQAKIS